jgi:hypothetical protein
MTQSKYQPRLGGVFCTGINVSTALHGSVIGVSEEKILHQHFKHLTSSFFSRSIPSTRAAI